jgi:transcription elongation factor Elf1
VHGLPPAERILIAVLRQCPYCGSTDVDIVEIGDEAAPDLLECEACGEQFEDPDHELAG